LASNIGISFLAKRVKRICAAFVKTQPVDQGAITRLAQQTSSVTDSNANTGDQQYLAITVKG
jgi:hypothetical protein